MPRALHQTAGFSLLGQLITLTLAGIMLSIAVPGYLKVMPRHRLNGAVRQLTGDLMWARMKAIQRNNRYRIFFLNDHEYRILDDADNDGAADPGEWSLTRDLRTDYRDV
ncbi:MAG: GspH/FimT family pseudopilin, partial [Deltaproteobacteria bacterium]|nr:GspH/FimT family pseudopilin [Deltaproteobacteria bacterium]